MTDGGRRGDSKYRGAARYRVNRRGVRTPIGTRSH